MRRWLYALLALAAVGTLSRLPHPAVDVGKLEPVAVVLIRAEEGQIILETDTGAIGAGEDLPAAVAELKDGASGEIFLDTADHVLLLGNVSEVIPAIWQEFRPACTVCRVAGEADLEAAAEYLAIHRPEVTLAKLRAGERHLETLRLEEGRGSLEA